MNKILFPTKTSTSSAQRPSAQAAAEERDPSGFQDPRGGHGGGGGSSARDRSRWEGLTPMEMVEQVTKLAEDKMTVSQGKLLSTHCVDPSLMSTDLIAGKDSYADTADNGKKRGRKTVADVIGSGAKMPGLIPTPAAPLLPWDPSYIIQTDPDPRKAKGIADKLGALAVDIEASPNYHLCTPSYKRVRDELAIRSQWIYSNHYYAPAVRRSSLDELYDDTIQKMEALAKMTKNLQPATAVVPMKVDAVTSGRTGLPSRSAAPSSAARNNKTKKNNGEPKKDFADYMQNWLRDNWTNPYPDDDGLAQIANDCGTTPTVVSNWLINARTRKWRPAIVKAFDHGRPADLLKEDAINIFEGKPLREVDGMPVLKSTTISGGKKKGRGKKRMKVNEE